MAKYRQFLVARPMHGKNLAPWQHAARAPTSSGRCHPHCTDQVVRVQRRVGQEGMKGMRELGKKCREKPQRATTSPETQ